MNDDMTVETSKPGKLALVDPGALVAALVFGAAGLIALAGTSLADVDPVVLAGVTLLVIGIARFVVVLLRARARRQSQKQDLSQYEGQEQDQITEA